MVSCQVFEWIESEPARAQADSMRTFVFSHAGPHVQQLSPAQSETFTEMMVDYGVELSIHGHMHSYRFGRPYDSALVSLMVDNIGSRNYSTLVVNDTGVVEERVFF